MTLTSLLERRRVTLRELGLAVFAVVFVCLSLSLFTPSYMENDDVTIADFAMRGFQVRYMGVFLTGLMHFGYLHFPEVAWYGLVLYACHFLGVYLWLSLLSRVFRPWWLGALYGLLFLGFYLVFLVHLDYTSTSVMLCCVSLSWAYVAVVEQRPGWLHYAGLGLAFMLGMMVRPQAAPGALLYTLPIGLLAAWSCLRSQPWRAGLRRLVVAGLLFLMPAAAEGTLDQAWRQVSATPQQAQYDKFNAIRGKLHRLNRGRKRHVMTDRRLLADAHWTRRDAAFFFNWNFLDERFDTPAALQTVFDGAPPPHNSAAAFLHSVKARVRGGPLSLLLAAALPLLLLYGWRRRLQGVLLLPLYAVLLTSFMYLYFAFTYRVELPFTVGFGFSSLALAGCLTARECAETGRLRLLAALMALAAASLGLDGLLMQQYRGYQNGQRLAQQVRQELHILNRDFAGSVIVVEPKTGLPLEQLSPLEVVHLNFTPVQLGWSTFSPRFYQQIGALGIQHGYELVDALITRDRAYVLGDRGFCIKLLPYATDGARVRPLLVEPFMRGVGVYRLETGQ